MAPVIGIDLGTTFSCTAILQDGHVEVIYNDRGKLTTPSVVNPFNTAIERFAQTRLRTHNNASHSSSISILAG